MQDLTELQDRLDAHDNQPAVLLEWIVVGMVLIEIAVICLL